jgi:O-antigen ligase
VSLPYWLPETTFQRLATTGKEIRAGGWTGRWEIWEAALKVLERHPIVGVGVGAFKVVVDRELPSGFPHQASAHNAYLNTAVELGVIGALLFVAILAWAGFYAITAPSGQRLLWIVTLATSALAAIALHTDTHKLLWFIVALLSSQCIAVAGHRVRTESRHMAALRRPQTYLLVAGRSARLARCRKLGSWIGTPPGGTGK